MTIEGRRVGRDAAAADVPLVAACLASAFHEDPLWGHWVFPDPSTRARDLLRFMTVITEAGSDEIWTSMTTAGESVAVWTPPGVRYGAPEQEASVQESFDALFGPRAAAIHALFEQFERHTPDGRFFHLEWWATRRDHAGRGHGAALIRENLSRIDAEHFPCYLESTNPANLTRYETLGFGRIDEFAPPGGPTITTMWREPR